MLKTIANWQHFIPQKCYFITKAKRKSVIGLFYLGMFLMGTIYVYSVRGKKAEGRSISNMQSGVFAKIANGF